MSWERGMEAADSAAENFLLPADLPGPTDRWRVLLGRKHTEAFLAEQPTTEWCSTHKAPWYEGTCLWSEDNLRASSLDECRAVTARLVVEP